mmetsp:Transcript_68677/g.153221  ORF Transcript_68677/g.153221 Transcript_68677/m.153221 type:complete len:134 (-) Transcript_68677:170-571(-)
MLHGNNERDLTKNSAQLMVTRAITFIIAQFHTCVWMERESTSLLYTELHSACMPISGSCTLAPIALHSDRTHADPEGIHPVSGLHARVDKHVAQLEEAPVVLEPIMARHVRRLKHYSAWAQCPGLLAQILRIA